MDTNAETPIQPIRRKARKRSKRDKLLAVHCSLSEAIIIKRKAEEMNLSVSEFLRDLGLYAEISIRDRPLTKEVLAFQGSLYQIMANQHLIIQKLMDEGQLTKQELSKLALQIEQWKQLPLLIKNKLK